MFRENRRGGVDRRKADSLNMQAPFLTKQGLVFTDRRKNPDRRVLAMEEIYELGEVEEIELKPLRYG